MKVVFFFISSKDDINAILFLFFLIKVSQIFLVAQMVKRLLIMQEARVGSLGWEDPLEKQMATHSRTLAWKLPWTEGCESPQSSGSQRIRHD